MTTMNASFQDLPLSTEDYNRSRRGLHLLRAALKELRAIPATCDERLSHGLTANQAHRFADALDTIYCLIMCNRQKPLHLLPAVEWLLRHALIDD